MTNSGKGTSPVTVAYGSSAPDVLLHVKNVRRSRAPEFYGFVALTSSYLAFIFYILWALVPDEYIIWIGIEWYPSREWALLIPSWSVVAIMTVYIVYSALAIATTPAFSDMNTITDRRVLFPLRDTPYLNPSNSPELYDIPIGMVNRMLYGKPSHESPSQQQN